MGMIILLVKILLEIGLRIQDIFIIRKHRRSKRRKIKHSFMVLRRKTFRSSQGNGEEGMRQEEKEGHTE